MRTIATEASNDSQITGWFTASTFVAVSGPCRTPRRPRIAVGAREDTCVGQRIRTGLSVDGTSFLFEPAARIPSSMIRLLVDAMDEYVPHFAVNHRFETSAFVGCTSESHRQSVSRPDPARAV